MLKNEKYKGDMIFQKTFTEDYKNGVRKKNVGQRTRYYVKGSHQVIISPEIFDKVQEGLMEPDCSEHLAAIKLAVASDIAANICLVIYWYVEIAWEDSGVEQSEGRLYGDVGQGWKKGRRSVKIHLP